MGSEMCIRDSYSASSLQLKLLPSAVAGAVPLLCDLSQGQPRPVVPRSLVQNVLRHFHEMSHVGGKATLRLIKARYVWFRMSSDCLDFVRSCHSCQSSKIIKHVHSPLVKRPLPDDRFLSLHLDLRTSVVKRSAAESPEKNNKIVLATGRVLGRDWC